VIDGKEQAIAPALKAGDKGIRRIAKKLGWRACNCSSGWLF